MSRQAGHDVEKPFSALFAMVESTMPGGVHAAEGPFQDACERLGVRVRRIPFGRRSMRESFASRLVVRLGDVLGYAFAVLRERPDIVHLNTAYDRPAILRDVGYAVVSRLLGQPLFLKLHGSDRGLARDQGVFWGMLSRFVLGTAAAVGVLSDEEKRIFLAAGYGAERFRVVKNAVNESRFAVADPVERGANRILFLARFIPAKGALDVVRAVRLLADRGWGVEADLVGDGPQRAEVEDLARQLAVADRIRFAGFVPERDTAHFYLEATLLAFPTYHGEGFSMTLFQAVAAGLPIVTTRVGAAADYLREPYNCLWVEPRNAEQLAEKILHLLERPELRQTMSENNRRLARNFQPLVVAEEYIAIYRACGRQRSAGFKTGSPPTGGPAAPTR